MAGRGAIAGLVLCGLAVACGPLRTTVETEFTDAMDRQAQAALGPGTARIAGSAFMRKANGSFISAGGDWVYLTPWTPYAAERFSKLYGGQRMNDGGIAVTTPADPRYVAAMRKVKAERSGRFAFDDVKAGRYFVSTALFWYPEGPWDTQGATLYDEVTVKDGETASVVLSGK